MISFFFLLVLSTLSLLANAAEIVTMSFPQCVKFEPIKMVGSAIFVGAGSAPATGKKQRILNFTSTNHDDDSYY